MKNTGMADTGKVEKVLFIDANKSIIRTVKTLLEQSGCEFIGVSNAFDALGITVEMKPDVIFIDINSAQLNGFEFCILLKSRTEFQNIPVILVATSVDIFEQAQAEVVGAESILLKPFNKAELLSAITSKHADAA